MKKQCVCILLLAIQSACGGNSSGGAIEGNGGTGGSANSSAGGSGSGSVTGGAGIGGSGAPSSSGAATAGLANCPEWPRGKVMPLVGIYFYGADPGPCTSSDFLESDPYSALKTSTYRYDGSGHLQSVVESTPMGDVESTCSWNGDTLVGCAIGNWPGQEATVQSYSSGPESLVTTTTTSNGSSTETYTLSSNGYPLRSVGTNTSGAKIRQSDYTYENCRLVGRTTVNSVTGVVPEGGVMSYMYDAAGHIELRKSNDGHVTAYEYGCWD